MLVRTLMIGATIGVLLAGGVHAEDVNPILGKVGDFVLREADLDRLIGYQAPAIQKKLQDEPQQRSNMLRQLLLTKAVAARARKEGFDRKPEMKERLSYVLDDYLAQEYLRQVVAAKVSVTDEELRKSYQEHEKEMALPERVKVRHIFVNAPADAPAELKGEARTKAEGLLQQLKKGEDFAKLASASSEDAETAAKGGEIGYLSPGKSNAEAFEKAAFALKVGEISGIVETPFGYHIIKAEERQEPRTATFDEVKEYLRQNLQGQLEEKASMEFLGKLMRDAGLEVAGEKGAEPKQEGNAPGK